MKILVTGGLGFIGSHLVTRLLQEGHWVICLDNGSTGRQLNVQAHLDNPAFQLIWHDVADPLPPALEEAGIQQIYHLAGRAGRRGGGARGGGGGGTLTPSPSPALRERGEL
ncbi:NAD-dependent epimerase/dehydratase family protein, partial [Synechococcus sp. W60.2]|uniref:NAD-dependent epimerase/dehydratase family protein n=1 Tax=Synechococcus sp. W60.2 TaxID=2964521 RepID=UPI0039C3FA88